jgi:hypothetical protein
VGATPRYGDVVCEAVLGGIACVCVGGAHMGACDMWLLVVLRRYVGDVDLTPRG